mmetsp:Transcript_11467/g.35077  ORF Transcript_11467/g.35077 Transcript_11467/m.35077 type:complete len:230 (+) Transcript_11467:525-1214(+)
MRTGRGGDPGVLPQQRAIHRSGVQGTLQHAVACAVLVEVVREARVQVIGAGLEEAVHAEADGERIVRCWSKVFGGHGAHGVRGPARHRQREGALHEGGGTVEGVEAAVSALWGAGAVPPVEQGRNAVHQHRGAILRRSQLRRTQADRRREQVVGRLRGFGFGLLARLLLLLQPLSLSLPVLTGGRDGVTQRSRQALLAPHPDGQHATLAHASESEALEGTTLPGGEIVR